MKRLLWVAIFGLAGVVLTAPSPAAAANYTTYVGCGLRADTPPAEACEAGDKIGAFFEADADVEFDVCVEFPSADFLCKEEQDAGADVLYVNEITTEEPGPYFVAWYVDEEEVGFWEFDLLAPEPDPVPVVPAPVVTPPAPVVAPPPPGPSPACKRAKGRVARLQAKLRRAEGKEAKAKVRPKLKAARGGARRLC